MTESAFAFVTVIVMLLVVATSLLWVKLINIQEKLEEIQKLGDKEGN